MQLDTAKRTTIILNGAPAETGAATLADLVAGQGFAEGDKVEIVAPRQGG